MTTARLVSASFPYRPTYGHDVLSFLTALHSWVSLRYLENTSRRVMRAAFLRPKTVLCLSKILACEKITDSMGMEEGIAFCR